MAVDGRFDHIELQDNVIYETIETKPTAPEKDLWKKMQSDRRRYKRTVVCVGLLCAVLALLNVAVPLYIHQTNAEMRRQLKMCNNLNDKEDEKRRLCELDGFTFDDDGRCYYISTKKQNWWKSKKWCRERQSDLIVIKSKEKQDFVDRVNKTVWLGLTDKGGKGSFEWMDGTPLVPPKYWLPGKPNKKQPNNTQQQCVEFLIKGLAPDTRGWNDTGCDTDNIWICERCPC